MTDDERGHFERGRWVPDCFVLVNGERVPVLGVSFSGSRRPTPTPPIPVGHYEKGRFVGGCFERKGDRLVCTTPGTVSIRIPRKS